MASRTRSSPSRVLGCCQAVLSALIALSWLSSSLANAYQVLISDKDDVRQVCSGMWGSGGSRDPWIEVIFSPSSRGQLALIIYEWDDARYIGIDADGSGAGENMWEDERIYVCTLTAYRANLCTADQLGSFIVDIPDGVDKNSTSIFSTAVRFDARAALGDSADSAPAGVNAGPFKYPVTKTGYYCVGAVPVTIETSSSSESRQLSSTAIVPRQDPAQGETDSQPTSGDSPSTGTTTQTTTTFTGVVDFENTFEGHLPASEYPKIYLYGLMALAYFAVGIAWAILCWKYRSEILPVQHYVSATIAFIIIEMIALNGYYRYLNSSGTASLAKPYLGLVAVLNAARNSISFFMLLIVCMGYGIVRPDLGSVMLRVRLLAIVHFVFGVMYSIGIVTIPLESAGIFIFFFVFPLAFSLTVFMMWIMWSLNATIQDLETRKQSFKKQMFTKLYRILIGAAIVIAAFFVISSISFSNRLEEDYASETWKSRWWLLDGWLAVLYLVCFCAIAFIWRPNPYNRRLAMSDELATDEADADEFEVDTLRRERLEDEERADRKSRAGPDASSGYDGVRRDEVVFDIGDEGDDSDEEAGRGESHRKSPSAAAGPRKSRASDDELRIAGQEGYRLRTSEGSDRVGGSSDERGSVNQPPRYSSLG